MPRVLDPVHSLFDQQLHRGALVVMPDAGDTFWVMRFQYNPETITRTRSGVWTHSRTQQGHPAPQERSLQDGHRGGGLYAKSETVAMKLVFDATELLLNQSPGAAETAARTLPFLGSLVSMVLGRTPAETGVLPELAVLEQIALGKETREASNRRRGGRNALVPVAPSELLLVLGPRRFPVVLTQMTITEKRFNPQMVPIRAEADVKFRVLETTEIADNAFAQRAFEALINQRHRAATEAVRTAEESTVEAAIAQAVQPRRSGS